MKLYVVKCPGCGKVAEHKLNDGATVHCGDCLMDRCEIVKMEIVKKGKDHEFASNED